MANIQSDDFNLYSSMDYNYSFSLILETTVRSKTDNVEPFVAKQDIIYPSAITVYDRKEFMQIDLLFKNNVEKQTEFNRFISALNIRDLQLKHRNHYILTSAKIIPNNYFPNSYLYLIYLECPVSIGTPPEGYTAISFCSPKQLSNVHLENGETKSYDNLKNIVEYNLITERERKYIQAMVGMHNKTSFSYQSKKSNGLSGLFSREKTPTDTVISSIHMTEQEKQIFDAEMLNVSTGAGNPEQELEELIGLEDVKTEILKLKSKLKYRAKQKQRNIIIDNSASMHMCFTGSPGTGKTTVARIITGILYNMGYIKENKCVEVNGQNLKGGYTGQTAIITKLVMKSAKNKVLFIDEAYALFDDYENGFGKEAVAVILKEMEDERDNTVVIFAGYKNDMEQFLLMNDGLKSRINRYIHFKNYNSIELASILMSILKKKKLYITEEALSKCVLTFKKAEMSERFSNGRFVRNMMEKIEYEHAYNTHSTQDAERQDTITVEDIPDELIEELLTRSM